jgi:hypothetical protein
MFSFLWVPEQSMDSATSFSQQQLTTTELQQLSHSLTHQTCPAYNILALTAQKTPFLYCCAIVAVETVLFVEPLLCNGCCIVAYLAVVA